MVWVNVNSETSNFHLSLDEAVECISDFIGHHKIVTNSNRNALSQKLNSELIAYSATFIALITSDYKIHSGIWNTFKKAVENRMLTIEDDSSKRDGIIKTSQGLAYAHFTSSYWGLMDKIEELVRAAYEFGLIKSDNELLSNKILSFLGWDSIHEQEFHNLFSDLVDFASNSIFPKVERTFS